MYIYIYPPVEGLPSVAQHRRLANETMEDVDVYFDDLTITHTGISIIQSTDYYPGGLVMRTEKDEDYRFGYQGQYAELDTITGWSHFEAREYNSRTGRWTTTDPKRAGASSYWGMNNNPVYYVDPDGRCPDCDDLFPDSSPLPGQMVSFGYGNDIVEYMYTSNGWDRITGGTLSEVVITPSNSQIVGNFLNSAAVDWVNAFAYVGTGIAMPIINQAGGGNVDWAKVYTFDKNWNRVGRNLDDGHMSVEESKEMMHYTVGFLTNLAPGTKAISSGKPFIDKAGNYLIVTTGKTVIKKTVDYSMDYHK